MNNHFKSIFSAYCNKLIIGVLGQTVRLIKSYRRGFDNRKIGFNLSKVLSAVLIISILTASVSATVPGTYGAVGEYRQGLAFWFYQQNWLSNIWNSLTVSTDTNQKTQPINRLEVYPGKEFSVGAGSKINFAAVAFNNNDEPIPGINFTWHVTDIGRRRATQPLKDGVFDAYLPGTYKITVKAQNKETEINIAVTGVAQELLDNALNNAPEKTVSSRAIAPEINQNDKNSAGEFDKTEKTETKQIESATENPTANSLPSDWNDGNWQTADDPGNTIGNPPGNPIDNGAGSGNFQIAAPVVGLTGRGINLSLSLNYNSRLWNKSGTEITYDIDRGNPAPGWSLGFGKIVYVGSQGGCMMIDADGTRHGYTGSISSNSSSASFKGRTIDGSFIDYGCNVYYGNSSTAWAKLSNGTQITYSTLGAANDHIYPTRIQDVQGNYITITYRSGQGPDIDTVTDTTGRVLQFQYDSLNRLISINAPRMGSGTRSLVKLHYKQLPLNYAFSGVTPIVRNSTPYVLDAIYYPATQTGYWFNDSDSYSSYGMIAKVVEQRGMSWSAGSEEQGVVTAGSMARQSVYSYPLSPNSSLNDAPTYGQVAETAEGMDVSGANVTTYQINNDTSPRTTVITQPDGTKSKQYSYKAPGLWNDGLVYLDEFYDADNNLLSSSNLTWAEGDYNSPRPVRTEMKDDRGQITATAFDYTGGKFNQVTRACDYGYGGNLLNCTSTEYENRQEYIGSTTNFVYTGRHIYNLVKATEIQNASGTKISRTEYKYDTATLQSVPPQVVQHNDENDPYTTSLKLVRGVCLEWEYTLQGEGGQSRQESPVDNVDNRFCVSWQWDEVSVFEPSTNYRGNVTEVKTFADVLNPASAIAGTKQYDITGNLVSTLTDGGNYASFTYNLGTQYAYPASQTLGSPDPNSAHRVTTGVTYDLNTGLVISNTDADGRVSTTEYNADTLRPTASRLSSGAYTTYGYDSAALAITEEVREANGAIASKTIKYLNGLGKIKREEALAANNTWDVSETKYDKLGRVWKQTNPYRSGVDTPQWTETFYDKMGRIEKAVSPDGSESKVFYNETTRPGSASNLPGQTVRSVDAWGRERWMLKDERGRATEVVEPNPNGNGSVFSTGSLVTKYKYNLQGKIVETEQGDQHRYFAYDSIGRLTRQKLAEKSATLNDAGVYVGAGHPDARWSEAFGYDIGSNVVQQTDARGVKTIFSYQTGGAVDPLNRLQSVSYDLSGPRDTSRPVAAAAAVSYEYATGGDKTRVKKITTQNVSTEEYTYDTEGRVSDYTLTVGSRPNHPMVTSYLYDTLDRVTDIRYPAQYGQANAPRKIVHHDYDPASRMTSLKYDGQLQASEITYDAASQATRLKIGTGANQLTEEYTYDLQTGFITNQKIKRAGGERLFDLSYEYRRKVNGSYVAGRTGHLTEALNNLDHNKDRAYEYDAVGRLTKASGGVNQSWTQQYGYDRYGNRTDVNASGVESLRSSEAQSKNDWEQQSGLAQNQSLAMNSPATVKPPTAEQLIKNANQFIERDNRKGPSDEGLNSTDNFESRNGDGTGDSTAEKSVAKQPETNVEEQTKPQLSSAGEVLGSAALTSTSTAFDFDGDGKSDISTWHRSGTTPPVGTWTVRRSQSGQTTATQLGAAGNQIVPGDYDGDGKTDEAVWNPTSGVWTIKQSTTGNTYYQNWGISTDTVVPADYDGDGKTDIAVWRGSDGVWYILKSSDGSWYGYPFGNGASFGDIPTVGDYDADGKADISVWRPSSGTFYTLQSSNGQVSYQQLGSNGDVPVPADYDADNKTDIAVWRPSNGCWYVYKSGSGQYMTVVLGSESTKDKLVPADYDGDRMADLAVWTPATNTWTIRQSGTGTNVTFQLGAGNSDIAVPSAYIRRSSAPKNQNTDIPRDGLESVSYNSATNRISTAGFEYDAAGNQTRVLAADGQTWQRFEYDAANRPVAVKNDTGTVLQETTYGAGNQRLIARDALSNQLTFYAWAGNNVIAEYSETSLQPNTPLWVKSYVFLSNRLLSVMTPNGTAAETAEYYHPDRLGTRVVSNPASGGFYEQVTLPFGTALASESTGATNRRFTSYDRNQTTGLDYAMNRNYDPQQGRFTQVDPLGMQSVTLEAPQTLNLYSYCGNDPINHTDPDGLFWGAIGRFFKKLGKFLSAIGQAIGKILNNRWVRIGVFIAGFLIPGLNILSEALAHAVSIALKAYNYIADIGALLEMSGQLLTGRFKELVITLGFAFLSAAISPLVEGAVSGAQNALFGGKFDELWDVFKGIGKGLADSWKDFTHNLLGRGLMGMIPGLDKFAGPDVPSDERLEDYRDFDNGLDGNQDGYKEHDFGLSNLKEIVNQTKNELIALGIDPKTAAWAVRRSYNIARGQMHARLVGRLITSAPRIRLTDIAFAGRPGVGSVFKFLALHYFSGAAVFRRFVR